MISGSAGNDLIFGDHGAVVGIAQLGDGSFAVRRPPAADRHAAPARPLRDPPEPAAPVRVDVDQHGTAGDGGAADLIRGNTGDDVIVGGQGADQILGNDGNDDIIGGHTGWLSPLRLGTALLIGDRYGAGGFDTGDTIDAGAGNDWIAGDNADPAAHRLVGRPAVPRPAGADDLRRRRQRPDRRQRRRLQHGRLAARPEQPLRPGRQRCRRRRPGNEERYVELFDHTIDAGAGHVRRRQHRRRRRGRRDLRPARRRHDPGRRLDDRRRRQRSRSTCSHTRMSVEDCAGIGRDGRDWVEGNGGDDTIFGGLGQDDLIGGSSNLYSLTTPNQRPDGSDMIFGGAGMRLAAQQLRRPRADGPRPRRRHDPRRQRRHLPPRRHQRPAVEPVRLPHLQLRQRTSRPSGSSRGRTASSTTRRAARPRPARSAPPTSSTARTATTRSTA